MNRKAVAPRRVRDLGYRWGGETEHLTRLCETHHATGNSAGACKAWKDALTILDELRHPDAEQVRARLADPAADRLTGKAYSAICRWNGTHVRLRRLLGDLAGGSLSVALDMTA